MYCTISGGYFASVSPFLSPLYINTIHHHNPAAAFAIPHSRAAMDDHQDEEGVSPLPTTTMLQDNKVKEIMSKVVSAQSAKNYSYIRILRFPCTVTRVTS